MKIKKICWIILVGVVLLVFCNGSTFAYKYEYEDLPPYDYDSKGGYTLFITNHMAAGPGAGWYVGAKENIEDDLLEFAPDEYDYIYDETLKEWIVVNPPLKINLNNLKISSSDENIIKFTKENGQIYINYLSKGDARVTAEYNFNGELYVVECKIYADSLGDEKNQDTTNTTNPDKNNNNSNQTEQTTTTIETPKQENESNHNDTITEPKTETPRQENEQKNNNINVETKTETKSPIININTNQNGNLNFNDEEVQNGDNDFLLDSENKLIDTEYNNYTFNSVDEGLKVDNSFSTNDEIKESKSATLERTKSNTSSSKYIGIIIVSMVVISVVIIAIIILIVKHSKNGVE